MALTIESLFVDLGGVRILKGVYLRVDPGRVTAVFGANGAGKTTLLGAVAGQVSVTSGITIIDEHRLPGPMRRERFRHIAYLPQDPMLPGSLRVRSAASLFGVSLSTISEDEILGPVAEQRISELSLGERRYLELVCVLALDRKYAVLDEPFMRLAPIIGEKMLSRIQSAAEAGTGVLVTDHYYRFLVDSVDRAYFLRNTRCRELDTTDLGRSLEELGYLPSTA